MSGRSAGADCSACGSLSAPHAGWLLTGRTPVAVTVGPPNCLTLSCLCADNVCEGFDHPDAPHTDVEDAARQLRAATAMEYRRMLARKPSKKQQKQQTAAAAAALPGGLQPPPAGMLQHQDSKAARTQHAVPQARGDAQQLQPSLQQGGDSRQQKQQHATEGLPSAASGAAAHQEGSKPAAAHTWQQRLFRLQQLASTSEDAQPP